MHVPSVNKSRHMEDGEIKDGNKFENRFDPLDIWKKEMMVKSEKGKSQVNLAQSDN